MFRILKELIRILTKSNKPLLLGRWKIEYGKKMTYKVDFANEDHCGPCGQYIKK
jgi:arginyl-tRNA--protein-N-Asp/Glu arginylyltransferase